MNNEYFLNQWFFRSLKRSRLSYSCASALYVRDCKPPCELNLDQVIVIFYLGLLVEIRLIMKICMNLIILYLFGSSYLIIVN